MKHRIYARWAGVGALALSLCFAVPVWAAGTMPAVVKADFVNPNPLYRSCHASTIVETPEGLVAAWFGGSDEGSPDVSIWLARNPGTGWEPAEEVANGIDLKAHIRYPCWNPVLFLQRNKQLLLFYKVGPSPEEWWGMLKMSPDYGKSWTKVRRLPSGFLGPVRNKPVELLNGTLLCGSSTEDKGWRVHFEWTADPFGLWMRTKPLNSAFTVQAIQPTILQWGDWKFQMLCRTKAGRIFESWSTNNAASWAPLARTILPNPDSAVDGVVLRDGRALIVYNHTTEGRNVLNVAVSENGKFWKAAGILENEREGEFSYPAVIQTKDNMVHVTYTWNRKQIKHVIIDPTKLQPVDMPEGVWPR